MGGGRVTKRPRARNNSNKRHDRYDRQFRTQPLNSVASRLLSAWANAGGQTERDFA